MTETSTSWPTQRSRRLGIAAQFGADRADLLQWALVTGDPLADAVVAEIHEGGRPVRAQLDRGIRQGLRSLTDPPPAVAALLTSTETLPDYADDDLVEHGSRPFHSSPGPVHMVSLSAGALIRVYESPSIARVLSTTGRLVDGAARRIQETGKWVNTIMLPGGLRPGGDGYVATLQVRMLHASVRHLARSRDFDEAAYGAPINQVDLGRTWMDFTLTSLRAEQAMGFGLTSAETARLYRYWWLVAHLLGVDARLVEGIADNEQAERVDAMFRAVTGPLTEESRTLAQATVESMTGQLHEALNIPTPLGSRAMHVMARRIHGDALADELGIERSAAVNAAIAAAIGVIRDRRLAVRQRPEKWEATIEANIADSRTLLGDMGDTQYESSARPEAGEAGATG